MLKRGFLKVRRVRRRKTIGLKRSVALHKPRRGRKIPKLGKSPVSVVKRQIQAQLRENAIERDKTCVVGQHKELLPENWYVCGPLRKDGEIIVQAEHLCGRTKSKCYADMDNIILLCMRHHFHFKRQRGALYWHIVRKHIGEERWARVQGWEADNAIYRYSAQDWRDKLQAILQFQHGTA